MASFGLSEALKSAVEASRTAKVVRPAEAELNARVADKKFQTSGVTPATDLKPAPMDLGAAPTANIPSDVSPGDDTPVTGAPAPTVADAAGGTDAVVATPDQAGDASLGSPAPTGVPDGAAEAVGNAPEPRDPQLAQDEKVPPQGGDPADGAVPPESVAQPEPVADPVPTDVETAAAKLSKANLGDFALDESHQPNFDVMQTTDDVKAVIAQAAEDNKGKIDDARRGVITNQQLTGLAADLNTSTDVIKQVLTRQNGGVLNPETILASRQVLDASAGRLQALAAKITAGTSSDLEKLQFARQSQFHNDFMSQFMGARAEAGRSLNAFSIPTGSNPAVIARMQEILQASGGDVNKLAKAIVLAGNNPGGIGKLVQGGLFSRSLQATTNFVNRVFVNGILSGPPTWGVVFTGNALMQAMNMGEMAVAARLGYFLPGAEHVAAGEAASTLAGTLNGFSDALRLGWRALKTNTTLDNVLRYDTDVGTAPKANVTSIVPETDLPYVGQFIRGVERVVDVPGSIIGAGDEFFKTLAYRGYVTKQTMLHVQDQIDSGAIKSADAAATARQYMENLPDDIQQSAEAWAHEVTFQSPLGPVGTAFTKALRSVPVLTLIAPFMRTATNVFKQSAARSPVALMTPKFWAAMGKGGADRDMALTRFVMGTGTAAVVANAVANDTITGGGPQNPQARTLWEQDGRKPYSIKVTNPVTNKTSWFTYARLEPIASVVGAVADATEIGAYIHADDDVDTMSDAETQHMQAAGAIIAGIMNNTGNKTFMQGISNFVELLNDPGRNIQHYAQQMAASMVPFSGAERFVRNTQDPYMREAWTTMDAIRNNLPGYSDKLPLTPDIFGQPRLTKSSSPIGLMSPIGETDAKSDPVVTELKAVMDQTRQVPVTMPDKRQGGVDGVGGMRLDAKEYSDLVRLARSEPIFGNGNTFKDQLQTTMDSNAYQNATPLQKADLLRKVQTSADKIGVQKLEEENPDYAERITAWRMKANRLKFDQ